MGYVIDIGGRRSLARSNTSKAEAFSEPFPADPDHPGARFPHLCFVFRDRLHLRGQVELSHVGAVFSAGQTVTSAFRRLEIAKVHALTSPISLAELQEYLSTTDHGALVVSLSARGGILSSSTDEAMVEVIRSRRPEFADVIDGLRRLRRERIRSASADRWELGLDALRTALRIGGFPTSELTRWAAPKAGTDPVLAGLGAVTEVSALAETLTGWTPSRGDVVRHCEFREGVHGMDIINAAPGCPERARAVVDLLYSHQESGNWLMVQHTQLTNNREIEVDGEFDRQLDRMDRLSGLLDPPRHHQTWQLGADVCYLKLCRARTESGEVDPANVELLAGLILPLSYARLALRDNRTHGPRGGRYLGYDQIERHLTNTLFLTLAREGWIGARPDNPPVLARVISESLAAGHEVIVAVDKSRESPKQRIQRHRARQRPGRAQRMSAGQQMLF